MYLFTVPDVKFYLILSKVLSGDVQYIAQDRNNGLLNFQIFTNLLPFVLSWCIQCCPSYGISSPQEIFPGASLTGVVVGVTDFQPRDQQTMNPSELNVRRCGQVTTAVVGGETVTLACPSGGVTGRYLIAQILGRAGYLVLCEVKAGRTNVSFSCWSCAIELSLFCPPCCNWYLIIIRW